MKHKNNIAARGAALLLTLAVTTGAFAATALAAKGSNAAPIAESRDYTTYRDIAITGSFSAVDPEGEQIYFNLTSEPKKGTVELSGEDGFIYTPEPGKKGRDSFTYTATDASGNTSAEAKVNITIKKQSTQVTYSDMEGNSAHYAALALAENNVFIGEKLGGEYFFRPDAPVTRSEFLAMCLNMCGSDMLSGVTRTGFADDNSIPAWAKPYISTALMSGIISGYKNGDGRLVFSPDSLITYSEAAVMLNNALSISDVMSVSAIREDAVPSWAYQAAVNLYACNVLPASVSDMGSDTLTRAEAAQMLLASMELLESRNSDISLLSWAK